MGNKEFRDSVFVSYKAFLEKNKFVKDLTSALAARAAYAATYTHVDKSYVNVCITKALKVSKLNHKDNAALVRKIKNILTKAVFEEFDRFEVIRKPHCTLNGQF